MSLLPLPPSIGDRLAEPTANLSMIFDRCFAGFKPNWEGFATDGGATKLSFLTGIATRPVSKEHRDDFKNFRTRRQAALAKVHTNKSDPEVAYAHELSFTTGTRLVLGLGLPNSVETGFLFDRLTGCPYIPGSSLKGMARAAANLIARGELSGDRTFWEENCLRLFGPTDVTQSSRKGQAIFYDAFPDQRPDLVADLLNPHYTKHLEDPDEVPADWHDPIPVPFLAIEVGATFRLFLGLRTAQGLVAFRRDHKDLLKLEELLKTAFDDLAIGGKKSSGYGYLHLPGGDSSSGTGEELPPPQAANKLTNVLLERDGSRILVRRSGKVVAQRAKSFILKSAPMKNLSKEQNALLRNGKLRAHVLVNSQLLKEVLELC